MRREAFARQQRGEHHDQKRPEIVDEAGLRRRRVPQRHEIQRVVAEQPADTDQPGERRLAQRRQPFTAHEGRDGADTGANGKGDRGQLEWRHASGCNGQRRKQRPHQDRRQTDQRGVHGRAVYRRNSPPAA